MSVTAVILPPALILSYFLLRRLLKKHPPYPPGPVPKPIIGNALDIPLKKPWIQYMNVSKQFNSSVIHMASLGNHIIVLNAIEDITELSDKRASNYSSRPPSPIIDMVGMRDILIMQPHGDSWRRQRRFIEQGLKKDALQQSQDIRAEKVHLFLDQLVHDPTRFTEHCKTLGTSVTMAVAYAYDVIPGRKDINIEMAEFALSKSAALMLPGRTMIAMIGFLRHVPPWVPGASTQKLGAEIRKAAVYYKHVPFMMVKENMAAGTAKNSILKQVLEANTNEDGSIKDEDNIRNAMAGFFVGGVETMPIVQAVFIMAMALHPEIQEKAQEEIDRVIGSSRLPTLADRPSLPYIDALYREVLRWRPVTPLSFARTSEKDDVYKGYYIPKGSFVLFNVWAVSRNEEKYPEPESFQPERYFNADGTLNNDTIMYAFGFGRRVCPARHLSDLVIWLTIASVLATFNISKAKDEHGNEIEIDRNAFTDSFACHPMPFQCSIVPRSEQSRLLISSAANVARENLNMT